jgi:hypothetical protein
VEFLHPVEDLTASQMLAQLTASVTALGLPAGIEQSLRAKLEAAGRAVDRGNDGAARGQLNAFVNQVSAQRGRHIDAEDADPLMQSAEAIMSLLGTGGGPLVGRERWRPAPEVPDTFGTLRLSTSSPSPFDPSTTIRYELPVPALVDLAVYDVRGRRVRSFQTAATPAGPHVIRWDGRDGSGSRVSAGVYFVRLTGDGDSRTRKVVLLGGR